MTLSVSEVAEGKQFEAVICENLTRTQIVQYAGTSGDYNPIHTDERFAKEVSGYPSVFADGMLTMGMTGRMLTDLVGVGRLTRFGGRFTSQVWPGDDLKTVATVTAIDTSGDEAIVELEVETTNQDGRAVFSGSAAARLDP